MHLRGVLKALNARLLGGVNFLTPCSPTVMMEQLERLLEEEREGEGELSRYSHGVRLPFLVDVLNVLEKIELLSPS